MNKITTLLNTLSEHIELSDITPADYGTPEFRELVAYVWEDAFTREVECMNGFTLEEYFAAKELDRIVNSHLHS